MVISVRVAGGIAEKIRAIAFDVTTCPNVSARSIIPAGKYGISTRRHSIGIRRERIQHGDLPEEFVAIADRCEERHAGILESTRLMNEDVRHPVRKRLPVDPPRFPLRAAVHSMSAASGAMSREWNRMLRVICVP